MRGLSYHDRLRRLVNEYTADGGNWPAQTLDIARWAKDKGLWKPQPNAEMGRFAKDLAEAMREERYDDAQGRRVRAKHAARVKRGAVQLYLWDDMRTATREHMAISVGNRREQIVGDCFSLKQDVDSFNENYNPGPDLPLVLDFSDDVEELEMMRGND